MELKLHTFDLPLKHTFTITHESRDVQPTLIVELSWHGKSGFGEATETPYYGVTMAKMKAQVESIIDLLPHDILPHPSDFWAMMSKTFSSESFFSRSKSLESDSPGTSSITK